MSNDAESGVRNPFEYGPYVQIAAICEKVLHEADGVLSLVRVVDVITHAETGPNPPQEMPVIHFPLSFVLVLKSGSAKGRHQVTITPEMPSGETLPPISLSVFLEGAGKGVQLISLIDITYKYEGLYWFNVRFDESILSRLPLEIRYSRTVKKA